MAALAVVAFVMLVVIVELVAAVLPVVVVLAFVPPGERPALVDVLAAADGPRRRRLWAGLRSIVR